MTYRIKKWDELFENNRTRELKVLNWVPFPNRHDGDGYTELIDHKNGAAHFGTWCALVQVASRCDPRGTLVRDGARPYDCVSLSRVTRISENIIKETLPRLVNIGWLEVCDNPAEGCDNPAQDCALPERKKEGNGTETEELHPQRCDTDELFWEEIKKLYTWVNVDQEHSKMKAWLLTAKGRGRKITRRFVTTWLNKIEKPMVEPAPVRRLEF